MLFRSGLERNGLSKEDIKDSLIKLVGTNGLFNKESFNYQNSTQLDKTVNELYKAFKDAGFELSKGYIEYSLIAAKAATNTKLTQEQQNTLNLNKDISPFEPQLFTGGNKVDGYTGLLNDISKEDTSIIEDLFDDKDGRGALGRLQKLADDNLMFDETKGSHSFKNSNNKDVYELIKESYVTASILKLRKESYLKQLESGKDSKSDINNKNFKFIQNNYLLKTFRETLKNLKLNIIDGLRVDKTDEEGVTFGDYDPRTYMVQQLAYFANKIGDNVKYIFRQNEASNTAYTIELPAQRLSENNLANQKVIDALYNGTFLSEFNRIGREFNAKKGKEYKNYNTKQNRAFDFTEFKYLEDVLPSGVYNNLVQLAKDFKKEDQIPQQLQDQIKQGIKDYLNEGIQRFTDKLFEHKLIYTFEKRENPDDINSPKHKVVQSKFFPTNLYEGTNPRYKSLQEAIAEFYLNDYLMSQSFNELLDGDYALSRKDKTDISKRNRGGMASGNNYGKGFHRKAVIKDIDSYVETTAVNNNLVRVPTGTKIEKELDENGNTDYEYIIKEGKKVKVSKITENDAQSYSSLLHKIFALNEHGLLNPRVYDLYKKLLRGNFENREIPSLTSSEIGFLTDNKVSLNPDKTVTFGQSIYVKTSEHYLKRDTISYIEKKDIAKYNEIINQIIEHLDNRNFDKDTLTDLTKQLVPLYKAVRGMEYWHNLANQMDTHGIDQVTTESAEKGAVLMPIDSLDSNFDLSKSMSDVPNEYKRVQVETPTDKETITDGSQITQLIDSEQDDSVKVNINGKEMSIGELRKTYRNLMNMTRNNSFKAAMSYLKELKDGSIDKTLLDKKLLRALINSGNDEVLLELFGEPYNFNLMNMVDKAEQIVLAHFSKNVLAQKVHGTKVSLVSAAGMNFVQDEKGNIIDPKVVSKNPEKYNKHSVRELKHNVPDGKGGAYSECILSIRALTKYGFKEGDVIPSDLLEALGYRIPTQDKHSMISLKIVGFLDEIYEGSGIFPKEIVHLSGADFDIDSLFIHLQDFWIKTDEKGNKHYIKYGTESQQDKFDAFKYYLEHSNNDFIQTQRDFEKQLKANKPKDQIDNREIKKQAFKMAAKQFDLPTDKKEFDTLKNGENLNNATLNNKILSSRIALLTNSHIMKEIAYQAATVKTLDKIRNKINSLKEQNTSTKYKVKDKNISASDANGKLDANTKNSAGKEGIGIVANKVQVFAWLSKYRQEFDKTAFRYFIKGEKGGIYDRLNDTKKRIADGLSTLLSIMVDNAKDPIAGDLGITPQLLSGYQELISQGLNMYSASLLLNLPILQEYSKNRQITDYALRDEVEKSLTKSKNLDYTISQFLLDKTSQEKEEILKELDKVTDISNGDMEKIIKGELKSDDINYYKVQVQALSQFNKIEEQAEFLANISKLLKLNKGLATTFDESSEVKTALDKLGIHYQWNEKNQTFDLTRNKEQEVILDILPLLKEDQATYGNIVKALTVLKKSEKLFITQTEKVQTALKKLCEINYCKYDTKTQYIWVCNLVHEQIGKKIDINDNRIKALQEIWKSLPLQLEFLENIYNKYYYAFHLDIEGEVWQDAFIH